MLPQRLAAPRSSRSPGLDARPLAKFDEQAFGGRDEDARCEGAGRKDSESESDDQADAVTGPFIARAVFRLRFCFVALWTISAACLAPCAYLLLLNAAPMTKQAPRGTESREALDLFQRHFPDLSHMRREMVVISCRTNCTSAASDTSRGIVSEISSLVLRFGSTYPNTDVRVNSYFTFTGHHQFGDNPLISRDKQSILLLWVWSVSDDMTSQSEELIRTVSGLIDEINMFQGPDGLVARLTGLVTLDLAEKETIIEEVPVHEATTIWLPFLILAFALRGPRMLLLCLVSLPVEILISFGITYFVSLKSTVLFYCVMTMLMLCTSLSFDYSLFLLTRYAEERAAGESVEQSLVTTLSQSGRVVVVSATVLVIAWLSSLLLPPPFNTFSFGCSIIIVITALAQLTFVTSLLAALPFLGPPAAEVAHVDGSSRELALGETLRAETRILVGGSPPARDDPMAKAEVHMHSFGFRMGKCLVAFPLNLLVPVLVYSLMMPLTLRMGRNFSLLEFRFTMGHSYEGGIPRNCEAWRTALDIQEDFPNSAGIMMPMLIIGTGSVPPQAAFGPDANASLPPAAGDSASATAAEGPSDDQDAVAAGGERGLGAPGVDVEGDAFFEANCHMVDSLIRATRGTSYALTVESFVSATFHEEDAEGGGVDCMAPDLINAIRTSYVSKNMLLTHTAENLQRLWDQLVSEDRSAMLTFAFPDMDPFSADAFSLTGVVREALRNETRRASAKSNPTNPGLTFTVFSPSAVLMDFVGVTSRMLPLSFALCVSLILLLIAVWFGAVLVPLKLFLTVVIPITWTYGAALYVYEDGALAWLGLPAVAPNGDAGLDWSVPVMTLTFIVGLAFDYEIFLLERVREFREEGFSDQDAILFGLAATSETITAAGLIMAITFSAELLGTIPVPNQMGFVLVFSILVDTFVVRCVLVPAILSIRSSLNFWPSASGGPPSPHRSDVDWGLPIPPEGRLKDAHGAPVAGGLPTSRAYEIPSSLAPVARQFHQHPSSPAASGSSFSSRPWVA